ncbi:MAG: hypothetical protein CENE_02445 [Candidatus Celerinatantimonas neptuna]|nr:MAG: hypothetical protein CENE_02445 [Candidatus Celerinatantimonas neptuna]
MQLNQQLNLDNGVSEMFPLNTGVSLKPCYYETLLQKRPPVGFLELHAENYLSDGGPRRYFLEQIREYYPITVHGVGLSIGGDQPLDIAHLERVAKLVEWSRPLLFSEHLSWSSHGRNYFNDLLPVIYDQTTLIRVCEHVDQVQQRLGQSILIENPSSYLAFSASERSECEFLHGLVERTGCGLLLDINNIVVSCHNLQKSCLDYLADYPVNAVRQFHLAGHSHDFSSQSQLKIDSHDQNIAPDVWTLFEKALSLTGDHLTLIERDANLPPFIELLEEAQMADKIRQSYQQLEWSL